MIAVIPSNDEGQSSQSIARECGSGKVPSNVRARLGQVDVMEGQAGVAALRPELGSLRRLRLLSTCQHRL